MRNRLEHWLRRRYRVGWQQGCRRGCWSAFVESVENLRRKVGLRALLVVLYDLFRSMLKVAGDVADAAVEQLADEGRCVDVVVVVGFRW